MSSVRTEQKNYEMPPRDGFTVTHFITVKLHSFYASQSKECGNLTSGEVPN
jgi:hypothetical protein